MSAALRNGHLVAFPLKKGAYGLARIGKVNVEANAMYVEVRAWSGPEAPTLPEAKKTRALVEKMYDRPMIYYVLSGNAPRGAVIVGFDAKAAKQEVKSSFGLSWSSLAEKARAELRIRAAPKTKEQKLKQEINDVVCDWRAGNYDNHFDAILDALNLLQKTKQLPAQSARVHKVLETATKQLVRLAAEDPDIARSLQSFRKSLPLKDRALIK